MPYYQRSWNVVFGDQVAKCNPKLRKVPASDTQQQVAPPPTTETNVDSLKVTFTREMLKKSVQELTSTVCAKPCKDDAEFLNYSIKKDETIFEGKYSQIFGCFNHKHPDNLMISRIYQPGSLIVPENDIYLKVLRYLGKKHPCIIATMDIYTDESKNIYVFQEYATEGNAYDYLKGGNAVSEKQMCQWAQSIYHAMDYLGDAAISHRSISPKHIVLKSLDTEDVIAKLSSFRDSIIYWDPVANDIIDQPCKPISKRAYLGFQAPEVFGSADELYNPIQADVWSFGASMFFIGARAYPYNMSNPGSDLDAEIHKNVTASKLSEPAKAWLYSLMRANTNLRLEFDAIQMDPWFKSF